VPNKPKPKTGGGGGGVFVSQTAKMASNVAEDPKSFGGGGTRSRVIAAKAKITQLTGAGVRINPKTATSFTRRKMKEAAASSGRLNKLFK